jgi:hypothetical protein
VAKRDVRGLWTALQDNRIPVTIDIDTLNPDGTFNVEAQHSNGSVTGNGNGRVTDRDIHFRIPWNNGTEGAYNGAFTPEGRINGATFDVKHPNNVTGWHSSKDFPLIP